jgi:2-isopropylmalate synthase
MKRVYICDTTLRDGEQTPGVNLNKNEKLEIAKQLTKLGVDAIEVGFPVTSKGDFEAAKLIADNIKGPNIVALARASKKDIDLAYDAIKSSEKPRIHIFIATSEIHMRHKLRMKPEDVLSRSIDMVTYAKTLCDDIQFSPEDATRTEPEFLYKVLEGVIEAGATVVNIPDTVGYAVPKEMGKIVSGIRKNVSNIEKATISVHCHNDLGLATANSIAGLENGAGQVECTINGLGERAGNAALEEIVMGLKTRNEYYNAFNNITSEQLYNTSSIVCKLTGVDIQPNKAIVGANAFAHESGIHQHGVLSCRETYEIMSPKTIGLSKNRMVIGKHSGHHAFEEKLKELGYENLRAEIIDEAFKKFKELTDKKKDIFDDDIEALISDELFVTKDGYKLLYFHISCGYKIVSAAHVRLGFHERIYDGEAFGDGPVDAIFNAIEKALGLKVNLKEYSLKSITSGKDALGEVRIKVECGDKIFIGKGISMDVIEASAKAYINGINKMKVK